MSFLLSSRNKFSLGLKIPKLVYVITFTTNTSVVQRIFRLILRLEEDLQIKIYDQINE